MRGTGQVEYKQVVSEGSIRFSIRILLETSLLWRLLERILRLGRWGDIGRLPLFGRRLGHDLIHWWVENLDGVGERLSWASLAFGIPTFHTGGQESEGAGPEG